jgi:hypothetical protein
MTTTMSIRELSRSGKLFGQYDYIDIEDKKAHDYKGVFVPAQYAEMVKGFLVQELEKEKRAEIEGIMQFAGILSGQTHGRSAQQIKADKLLDETP